ncbi:MAG: hypothetical protein FJX47_15610 [Alphaproteobacteria bacterium]|nr:hypothetical protein [Alphaproteobacteria bacterium]
MQAPKGAKNFQVIEPTSKIADKVSRGGPEPAAMISRAEAKIDEIKQDYGKWLEEDMKILLAAFDKLRIDPANRKTNARALFDAAFDIKGQAGTFGYAALSRIAKSLCRLLEEKAAIVDDDLPVVLHHVDAMRVVVADQIVGKPVGIPLEVIAGLESLVSKRLLR